MLPPTGGRGVGMAPSLTGRGWGWVVFLAAEAVSRFPGPPLEDPPTSPPRNSTGERGGSAVGRLAQGLPPPNGRRSVAADVPARVAQRLQRSRPNDHEQPRLCGRRDTKRSDWRGGRAAASIHPHSCTPAFSGPAPGLAGDRGGVRDARAPSEANCERGPIAKRASVMRSMTDEEARDPRHGKGPPRAYAGSAGLTVLRQRRKPVRGETPVPRWLDAKRDTAAPRSGATPRPTETWQQWHLGAHRRIQRLPLLDRLEPGKQSSLPPDRTSETTRPSSKPSHRRLGHLAVKRELAMRARRPPAAHAPIHIRRTLGAKQGLRLRVTGGAWEVRP